LSAFAFTAIIYYLSDFEDGEQRLFLQANPNAYEILDKKIEEAFLTYIPKFQKNYKDQQEYF
jgi:hypothetical protein